MTDLTFNYMFNDFFKKELEKRIKETNVTDVITDNIDDILKRC